MRMNASARRLAGLAFGLILGLAGTAAAQMPSFERIERGRDLAAQGDCTGCHTLRGGPPFAGGVALQTPFGTLVAPNITPDRETGIGAWSEEEFLRSMHEGIAAGGKRLYPAMPYTAYTRMSERDVRDIWAYLRTVEPVRNAIEPNQLPFPFNIRAVMWVWNTLNFSPGRFRPDPNRSEQWNRGAYLVEGAGHCGTCHTPKTFLGADRSGEALRGAVLQGWYAPPITGNPWQGVGGWSAEEIVQYLRTGANRHAMASGPMAEVVENSTMHMKEEDLRAIAAYLREVPDPAAKPAPLASEDPRLRTGGAIYADTCSACHVSQGQGVTMLFPRLAGSAHVQAPDPTSLIRMVVEGSRPVATPSAPTAPAMPSLGWRLSDRQVADVLSYIRNSWGNAAPPVTPEQVRRTREGLRSAAGG